MFTEAFTEKMMVSVQSTSCLGRFVSIILELIETLI